MRRAAAVGRVVPGPDAAHSQDFLYGEDGLPLWWWPVPRP